MTPLLSCKPGAARNNRAWFGLGLARAAFTVLIMLLPLLLLGGCGAPELHADAALTRNVRLELVDWHIVGLWVINCPNCWFRVENYNEVPIKNVTLRYKTYGYNGELLDTGTYTMDGEVGPGRAKNFIEQYLGLVNLESDMLSVELVSVDAENH
ncbi:MAG: hypothetical protein KC777_11400 [Cyanobacteria bacterium HKST-UBA02]|nr:hypothetical protein [Cyanobacteria bacterium HKST-UBA02]